jgi:hypothetical protein
MAGPADRAACGSFATRSSAGIALSVVLPRAGLLMRSFLNIQR